MTTSYHDLPKVQQFMCSISFNELVFLWISVSLVVLGTQRTGELKKDYDFIYQFPFVAVEGILSSCFLYPNHRFSTQNMFNVCAKQNAKYLLHHLI